MTKTPRGITARQLIRALHADGFILRSGSHGMFFYAVGTFRVRSGPKAHGTANVPWLPGLRAMLADAGWDDDNLRCLGFA